MSTKPVTCPICRRKPDPRLTPFCSTRCADVDLGRWLTGQYVAPGETIDPANDDPDERS
jgi:uncharacterized protein